jgi:UDP-3-O-[3-hydroxymyristoyl] N-acetylglucosamine deacetylase/3-hydroxyacyl-[acyl-carrier-protein] dehydratase
LAAFAGLQIDNIIVELDGCEPPVCDGSAKPFVDKLLEAGIENQDADKFYLEIDTPMAYSEPERKVDLVVAPSDDLRITFMIDYQSPALGTQYTTLVDLEKEFVDEFSPSRTFCFLSEVEMLKENGLIKGGGLDNAIVIYDSDLGQVEVDRIRKALDLKDKAFVGENGIINDIPLRFYNEPVRHKTLDLLGDLMLIGAPFKGHVLAARSGHKANVELARRMRQLYKKKKMAAKFSKGNGKALLDISAILNIMPHRYPMLLIDRIIDLEPDKRVSAIKNVTINEPFFVGHFPDHPIMPGVMILEAMAQAGGILLLNTIDNPQSKVVYFMSIDNAKFRKPVTPGDQLRFELEMISFRRSACKMAGMAFVGDDIVASADFMAMVMDR